MMESVQWTPDFVTGLQNVDKQHAHLIAVINSLGDALTHEEGATPEEIETVIGELIAYAVYHFREEESLMDESGIDPAHITFHKRAHEDFAIQVAQLKGSIAPDDLDGARRLHRFLLHWLAYHILGTDQTMAKQIAAVQKGVAVDQVQSRRAPSERATETLLRALDALFLEVSARNRELYRLNQVLEQKVADRTRALSAALSQLEDIAHTDALTGLPNRRHAMRTFEREWKTSDETGIPLACMMIDADHFKEINDTAGHDAGDEVLRRLAECLRDHVRTDDVVCRLGGDEFLILCPKTSLEGALRLAEQVRGAVASLRVPAGQATWVGSISVGVAARRDGMATIEDLLKVADDGVYVAKRRGRGCVATVQVRNPHSVAPSSLEFFMP